MKKYIKINIIMILTIVTFLVGINNAKALVCEYYLPFSGIDASSGKYVMPNRNDPCYASDIGNAYCRAYATISNGYITDAKCYGSGYHWYNFISAAVQQTFSSYIVAGWYDLFYVPGYDLAPTGGVIDTRENPNYIVDFFNFSKPDTYENQYHILKMLGYSADGSDNDSKNVQRFKLFFQPIVEKYSEDISGSLTNLIKVDTKMLEEGACPKYLVLEKAKNDIFLRGSGFYDRLFDTVPGVSAGKSCTLHSDRNYIGPVSYETKNEKSLNDKYYMKYVSLDGDDAVNYFKSYLKEFYRLGIDSSTENSISVSDFYSNQDYYILPYYKKSYDIEEQTKQVQNAKEGAEAYISVFDEAWFNRMQMFEKSLGDKCGSNWYDRINQHNYNFSNYNDFYKYAETDYGSATLKDFDKDISKECWNERQDFMYAFESLQLFFYGMGADTYGVLEKLSQTEDDSISDKEYLEKLEAAIEENPEFENLYYRVYLLNSERRQHFKYLSYFTEAVKIGTKDTPDKFKTINDLVERKESVVNNVTLKGYAYNVIRTDPCAYKCGTVTTLDAYEGCKNHNPEYTRCNNAREQCAAKICNVCNSVKDDYAFSQCYKNCELTEEQIKCIEEHGIENFAEKRQEAIDKALNDYNDAVKLKEDMDAASDYTYEPTPIPRISFNFKEYVPKCEDVKILTNIWKILTLLAPFLVIIFGSLDYFKAVISSNEEEMKKSKKKLPKRLIAFVILLVLPILIKVLLSNFGVGSSNNLTLLKCIINGDTGDNSTDEEETSSTNQSSSSNSNNENKDSKDSKSSNSSTDKDDKENGTKSKGNESSSKETKKEENTEQIDNSNPVIDPGPRR